jgi:nitric oxide dioxygenase
MADVAYAETIEVAEPSPHPAKHISVEHSQLVQSSYRLVEPASDLVATLFFRRLLEIAPELQPMMEGDEAEQRRQLLISLGLAVASLDRFDDIVPALQLLGVKYRTLGITEFHYGAVGEALLWTLKQSLGSHWSTDAEDAWSAMCTLIAEIMTACE